MQWSANRDIGVGDWPAAVASPRSHGRGRPRDTRVAAGATLRPYGEISPAIVPVRNVASEPAMMERSPSLARSLRRSGTMPPRPPRTMASDPKLANPQREKLAMRRLLTDSSAGWLVIIW